MDPRNANVLYASMYQRLRSGFGFNGGGPGSALYKSEDGGATWRKIESGLPTGDKGRIGIAVAKSNPNVVVATVEHATGSGFYRSEDAGATWKQMSRTDPRPMYYSAPFIDPNTDQRIWLMNVQPMKSEDGEQDVHHDAQLADLRPGAQGRSSLALDRSHQHQAHAARRRWRSQRKLGSGHHVQPHQQLRRRTVLSHRSR